MSANVAQQNNQNAQNTAQAGYNAEAAAGNFNSQNMWDGILKGVGAFVGGGGLNGFGLGAPSNAGAASYGGGGMAGPIE
jgi:hypothetical protein